MDFILLVNLLMHKCQKTGLKPYASKLQMPESRLLHACQYKNYHSMKTVRPTAKSLLVHYSPLNFVSSGVIGKTGCQMWN